ncbi:MAG TPA: hypothetical protein VKB69_12835 [Micromonosporaceae bacterium]|nr:hypothetical protein [Micromonosporaceae bacterium]
MTQIRSHFRRHRMIRLFLVAAMTALVGSAVAASPASATVHPDGDTPAGFWYGTDSSYMAVSGSGPYYEPVIGGSYGGYIGMVGNWAVWQHCAGDKVVWSPTDALHADTNLTTYHRGIGVGVYWFMAGPGVDPHYDGTTSEAYAWGEAQAAETLALIPHLSSRMTYPVVFMDIELPGHAPGYTPASDNGWNSIYTSTCSGVVKTLHIPASVDRADLNGYAAYLTGHSSYFAGVYSAPSIWPTIFGTGSASILSNTYEWTYNADTSSLTHHPSGWCLSGTSTCAQFFAGQTSASKYALMWQWSGGGGTRNGVGDFDQIDAARTP